MKYLNCMGCQVLLLVVLALVTGGLANLLRSGNPEKFLPWTTDIYAAPEKPIAEKPETPLENPGSEVPDSGTSQPEGTTPEGGTQPEGTRTDDRPSDRPPTDKPEPPGKVEFTRIGFEEAVEEFEAGTTFVDARRTKYYVEGHITGATSISPYEQSLLAEKIMRLSEQVPEEAPIVVYCTASEDCEDSAIISRQLQTAGFQNIVIYKGGFPEWEAKLRNDERRSKLITKGEEPGERNL